MDAVILGLIAGVIFGLTGSGGGILATPFLMYGLKMPIHEAIVVTLITLSFTGIVGVIKLFKTKSIDWHAGVVIAIAGTIFSSLGSLLSPKIQAYTLTNIFALFLLLMAALIWRNSFHKQQEAKVFTQTQYYSRLLAIGAVSGFLNGLLGISGGVIIVSSLIIFMSFSMRAAAAVSIFIVAIVSTIGAISHYIFSPESFNGMLALIFVISSGTGMFIAAQYASLIPEAYVKRGLAIMIFMLGLFMFINQDLQTIESLF